MIRARLQANSQVRYPAAPTLRPPLVLLRLVCSVRVGCEVTAVLRRVPPLRLCLCHKLGRVCFKVLQETNTAWGLPEEGDGGLKDERSLASQT